MAITKQKKEEIVKKATAYGKDSDSMVFLSFKGLKVTDSTAMRKELKKMGVSMHVLKKTLLRRALNALKISGELPELPGEIAVAYGKDLLVPARESHVFVKKFKDVLMIVGGVFEKRFMSKAEMHGIATIPPLQVLHGQFVNIINSPIQGLVISLKAIADKKQ